MKKKRNKRGKRENNDQKVIFFMLNFLNNRPIDFYKNKSRPQGTVLMGSVKLLNFKRALSYKIFCVHVNNHISLTVKILGNSKL